ncbi:MAG: hypothetical protein JJV88_00225 [Sulfurovum sp.]|nr:hypothetical protein [Sulfurovaceae bacterium]
MFGFDLGFNFGGSNLVANINSHFKTSQDKYFMTKDGDYFDILSVGDYFKTSQDMKFKTKEDRYFLIKEEEN